MADELSRLMFYDKEDRPWPAHRLTSSAIVGHVTTTTARIWVRVHKPGDYCLLVSEFEIDCTRKPRLREDGRVELIDSCSEAKLLDAQVLKASIDYSTDNTHVFVARKLAASTRHFYALFSMSERPEPWEIARDDAHSFRTQATSFESLTFGLFSCHMPFKGRNVQNLNMWESFLELLQDTHASFVVGCGDQVYTDGDDRVSIWAWLKSRKDEVSKLTNVQQRAVMLSWYRDIFRGYWGYISLRKVFRSFPNYMIWDDHEIMDGWGSYTEKELSNELDTIWEWENPKKNLRLARNMFEAAKQAYFEYEHSHNPKTPKGQWDYAFKWSRLAFFVFDMRGYRAYNNDSSKSQILGRAQWTRFSKWLKSPAAAASPALFIVSPVPLVHLSAFIANTLDLPALGLADDLRDEWEHKSNHKERNKLLDQVFEFSDTHKKPVIFLSGDVHIGAAFKITRKGKLNAKVFQLTSSAITYAKAPGKLLKLIVKKRGKIQGVPERNRTSFQCLHVFDDNNFGLIHVRNKAKQKTEISWDLYGSTGEEDQVVRLKRLHLN